MFKLKTLSKEAIPSALEKAERYRLLNEPLEAECICLDILEIDPENQQALVTLLLALTDQFKHQLSPAFTKSREVLSRLRDEYSKAYYSGIIYERRAKTHLDRGTPGSGHSAYEYLEQAMESYEKALELRQPGNEDPILRWNTCARIIMRNPDVVPALKTGEQMLE